jgi:hypothetical protein
MWCKNARGFELLAFFVFVTLFRRDAALGWGNGCSYGCGGSADLAKGYHIFAAKAAYCRRDAAPHTRGLTQWWRKKLRHYGAERVVRRKWWGCGARAKKPGGECRALCV